MKTAESINEVQNQDYPSRMWFALFKNGLVAVELNSWEEACEQFHSALKVTAQFNGNDPRILVTLDQLAEALDNLARHDEAIQVVQRQVTLKFKILGPNTKSFLMELRRLVYLYARKGDWFNARGTQMLIDSLVHRHNFVETQVSNGGMIDSTEVQTQTHDFKPVSISDVQLIKNLGLPMWSQQKRRGLMSTTLNLPVKVRSANAG